MKKIVVLSGLLLFVCCSANAQRTTKSLNGTWDFEQTKTAYPPEKFTRTIPVPGLISLAEPKIDDYDQLFYRPETVNYESEHLIKNLQYEPKYNWYRLKVEIPEKLDGKNTVLTLLKSKYVTQVYINGMDAGWSMESYTPIDLPVTEYLKFGEENEILVRVGDRAWLPSQAAGSTDKEKINCLPGIWDEVFLTFTDEFRVHKSLILPSVKNEKVTAKLLVRSFYPPQSGYGDQMKDTLDVKIYIRERKNGKLISSVEKSMVAIRDNITKFETKIPVKNPHLWTSDDPFLYTAEVQLYDDGKLSDTKTERFGMRDFNRDGKHFTLNGEKIYLRGGNITLHRFFEDPDAKALPWNREWVEKLLGELPKKMNWNAMRICVGIAPRMWYEVADSMGIMLQNEWLYWQDHGWDQQIKKEYTDWVWSDGSHPSIVIWDAINENWNTYVGEELIPELKQLDNTRIWDVGYMTGSDMSLNEMDEPHTYRVFGHEKIPDDHSYNLGDLNERGPKLLEALQSSAAQIVNEYGWMWLWRDGTPAKLMQYTYPYYLGEDHTTEQRRYLQAYWEQLQTEWLRSHRSIAGVLAFCYLTNNYGYTGDWFVGDIKDLTPGPTMDWFTHIFAPTAIFVDITDQRYTKHISPEEPGSTFSFNLVGVNDRDHTVSGTVTLKLLDDDGKEAIQNITRKVSIPEYGRKFLPISIRLPTEKGGYLVLAEFTPDDPGEASGVLSRRYINVGELENYDYFDYKPDPLEKQQQVSSN